MAQHKQYKHPPIREATIYLDFAENLFASSDEIKESAKGLLEAEFNESAEVFEHAVTTEFDAETDTPVSSIGKNAVIGVAFRTPDDGGRCVVVLGMDHLSFAWHGQYRGWDNLADRARAILDRLSNLVKLPQPVRIGVKYLNQITFDYSDKFVLAKYLRTLPDFSLDLPDTTALDRYFLQINLAQRDIDADVTINQVLLPISDEQVPILFEIDVTKQRGLDEDIEKLWECIGQLHERENQIFEASFTELAKDSFQ